METAESFRAFRIHADEGAHRAGLETLRLEDLTPGEVVVRVSYSAINYKDALAGTGRGDILRRSPLNGGIDLAGTVLASESPEFRPGDAVLATGGGLSETLDGGYAGLARLPAAIVQPLPAGLSAEDAMVLGTAGFTAALALERMEALGQSPELGPVLVTGASGGVGACAVALLANHGYEAVAVSGKPGAADWLQALGAARVLPREGLDLADRPLARARWGGVIDVLGGDWLAGLLPQIHPWGSVACIGLVAGHRLSTTVMPLILRGVSLVGVSSANCPPGRRRRIWAGLGGAWRPDQIAAIRAGRVPLEDLPEAFGRVLAGQLHGRLVVELG